MIETILRLPFKTPPLFSLSISTVPIRLDPNTSHPLLAFSDDKLEVSRGSQRPNVIDHPCRFNSWHCVLGDRFFTSGHHYWEVEATPTGSWRLGLTTVTSSRRNRFEITPAKGYWTLWGYWTQSGSRQLFACNDQPIKLPSVNWVGIYLDYEEGQVSFYDVEKRSHIYTFSDTFKGGGRSCVCLSGCLHKAQNCDTREISATLETHISTPLDETPWVKPYRPRVKLQCIKMFD